MGAGYRVGQFFRAVAALAEGDLREPDRALVREVLPADLQVLFLRMAPNDQRHSLGVYRKLQGQGHADADLLAAALLHDCGKALGRIALWQRVTLVLVKAVRPALLNWLAGPDDSASGRSWRYAFYLQREHARLGADLASQAGAAPATVAYIRRHEAPPETSPRTPEQGLLLALQRADSVS
jgi:hypothetical protein